MMFKVSTALHIRCRLCTISDELERYNKMCNEQHHETPTSAIPPNITYENLCWQDREGEEPREILTEFCRKSEGKCARRIFLRGSQENILIIRKYVTRFCSDSFGSGWSPELGSSTHCNELPAFTKYEEFIYQPRQYISLNEQ